MQRNMKSENHGEKHLWRGFFDADMPLCYI